MNKSFLISLALFMLATISLSAQDIQSGLVAHWTFDNDSGNAVKDATSNQFHGTAYNITYENGPVAKAAVFNGVDSRIFFPDVNENPPAAIGNLDHGSISVWFKFHSLGPDILPLLYFGASEESSPHNSLIIEVGHNQDANDRRLYFTIIVAPYNVTRFCFDSGFNLEEDTWYHFVAVVSQDGNTGYLNGQELTQRRYNLSSDASYTDFFLEVTKKEMLALGIGRYGRNSSFFPYKGSLDDVRIYNRPLSAQDVAALYALGNTTGMYPASGNVPGLRLFPNHPNPFAHHTLIRWQSETAGHTLLNVFDGKGRKVQTVIDNTLPPGQHTMDFHAGNLPSGVYFYRLQHGSEQLADRMLLLR
jgi:hypothetical protein